MNKLRIFAVALGLAQSVSAFAEPTMVCRMDSQGGTDLIATITETEGNLFQRDEAGGRGVVRIRPVRPLKIQHSLQFEVSSELSKTARLRITSLTMPFGDGYLFRLNSDENPQDGDLSAEITYGRVTFPSVCRMTQD